MSKKPKVNQLKWFHLKAKKKMKSPNPDTGSTRFHFILNMLLLDRDPLT
jgi:hypothetical protein